LNLSKYNSGATAGQVLDVRFAFLRLPYPQSQRLCLALCIGVSHEVGFRLAQRVMNGQSRLDQTDVHVCTAVRQLADNEAFRIDRSVCQGEKAAHDEASQVALSLGPKRPLGRRRLDAQQFHPVALSLFCEKDQPVAREQLCRSARMDGVCSSCLHTGQQTAEYEKDQPLIGAVA